jgi:hypothetical protein
MSGWQPSIDHDAGAAQPFIVRNISFFESEHYYAPASTRP